MAEDSDRPEYSVAKEWPTWFALCGCYCVWLVSIVWHESLGGFWVVPAILSLTLHSSLQHEAIHNHPTRSALLNELVVAPALTWWLPYRRYKTLHLTHHKDTRLTDPLDDPESYYHTASQWRNYSTLTKTTLRINATLCGRLVIGPALAMHGFWRSELSLLKSGNRDVQFAWLVHLASVLPVLFFLVLFEVNLLTYFILVIYPSISIILIRSFIEHRAAENISERTCVVESRLFFGFLFLNNNLHAVHHRYPALAWYLLPARWNKERSAILEKNAGYYFRGGYLDVFRLFFVKQREPLVHPDSQ